jgi:uncharacterized protein YutE (UPF0331/DUF86 family)/predicted nucleotidyltransferase
MDLERALRDFFDQKDDHRVVSAYLHGSHAVGRAHGQSDVDVAVLLDRGRYPSPQDRFDARVLLGSELIAALHQNEVDVVILNDSPPPLGRRIVTEGRRVFCSDAETDRRYVRDVQLRAADLDSWLRDERDQARSPAPMTLIERLADLRRHLGHLREIRPAVTGPEELEANLSLQNDVLHSLLVVSQSVIDIAGELSGRQGLRFQDYTEAVRNLAKIGPFSASLVRALESLPGFRNVLIHEYVALEMGRVIEALDRLEPIERFADVVAELAAGAQLSGG